MKARKVLLLGSGALKIGEAGEFDYSGSQAIKALKEEGIEVVLVNPNIATVQTSWGMADRVYFLPVNAFFVERVIKKEKPDAILLGFGGQTALNCGLELWKKGVFRKHGVKVIGSSMEAIEKTEDRELFKRELESISVSTPKSVSVKSVSAALKAGKRIGFPLIIRSAFALGGKGSAVVFNEKELNERVSLALSEAKQVLVEEYLKGWKEVEYEVVRDKAGNCVTVCNMENLDPMGIHTGESVVVSPSQTLSNSEYHKLRALSIKVVEHFGIVGECNVQFALSPDSEQCRVIEVNARLSRSSALASKATGYPLAFIAAKLALEKKLTELENSVTKKTLACFEPALDYVVVKIPRWDLQKFRNVSKEISSEMKSVGEAMGIGRSFEEALQKTIRMVAPQSNGLTGNGNSFRNLKKLIARPTDQRLFVIGKALEKGMGVKKIHELSGIDEWFLFKMKNIVETGKKLERKGRSGLLKEELLEAKRLGFSDRQIALLVKGKEEAVRKKRKFLGVKPFIKQIDTLAAEFPAKTNYLYLTYNGSGHDVKEFKKKAVIVLGSGAYSIGSSVEFDWCCVSTARELRKKGFSPVVINYNPETVSTDFNECDALFFEELSFERVLDVFELVKPLGLIISVGGQASNNLAVKCLKHGLRVLGTQPKNIDRAENRHKFSRLLDSLKIDQPEWKELSSLREAKSFSRRVGFPVLVRPSYVLSGSAMNVAFNERDLQQYLESAALVSKDCPVVISKFITNARELEIDAVAAKGNLLVWAVSEHIENAGVHSGDATIVLPPQKTYIETIKRIKEVTKRIAFSLEISGPFNIQFIAKNNEIKVIECNLRASRSFPFVSKVSGTNFMELAVKAMLGLEARPVSKSVLELEHVGVKAPQFSFSRLKGADPILRVEMASTGEVACLGRDLDDALFKSILSTGFKAPKKNVLVSIGGEENRYKLLNSLKKLKENGFEFFATKHTSVFLKENGLENTMLFKLHEEKKPNVLNYLKEKKLDLVICVQDHFYQNALKDEYLLRRMAVDYSIPLLTNLQIAKAFIESVTNRKIGELEVKSWGEYLE